MSNPFTHITLPEAARRAGVHRTAVHFWVKRGWLLAVRAGVRAWLVEEQELERFLQERTAGRNSRQNLNQ